MKRAFNDAAPILTDTALVEDFLALARMETTADEGSDSWPSTPGQLVALEWLEERLKAIGLADAERDENGYLFATLPGNVPDAPTVGLLAHVDTAPDFSGKNVNPIFHDPYRGGSIELPNGVLITSRQSPEILDCVGDTIITSDGSTLLGADDKAGAAEILAALTVLVANPDLPRPTIRVGFTPDEEVGRGAERFDVARFGADAAYTVDGGFAGEVNAETFCADAAKITFTGVAVHPGYAKGKLINALRSLGRLLDRLPADESPEATDGREGFIHPTNISGNASEATLKLIIRDFDEKELKMRGHRLRRLVEAIEEEEPRLKTHVEITETYRNMSIWLAKRPDVADRLVQAVHDAGIEPVLKPIRGGTDGSGLTAKGLPTPNIFSGAMQIHGPREWVSTRVMAQAVCTLLNLVQRWTEAAPA